MRRSRFLQKIRAGKVARLCALGHYLPYYPRTAAAAGFDAIWVDGEHKVFDPREVQAMIAHHHLADIDCLWRPPIREKAALYRFLEDGASGLIIPHVESVDEARALVQAVRFPPLGNRGIDGGGLDADYALAGGKDYPEAANRETVLLVQIETPQALEQAEAIAAIKGVDGIFLGPGDMALRLGCGTSPNDPTMAKVQRRVADAVAKVGKVWGCPVTNEEDLRLTLAAKAGFVVHGSDARFVRQGLKDNGKAFAKLLGEAE